MSRTMVITKVPRWIEPIDVQGHLSSMDVCMEVAEIAQAEEQAEIEALARDLFVASIGSFDADAEIIFDWAEGFINFRDEWREKRRSGE